MSKNIAVLMGSINLENQRQIMDGMIDAIKNTDNNIFIFTNHFNRQDDKENTRGAYRIMGLPDFEYFDGAIIAPNTILHSETADFVMAKLQNSKIPFITLNHQIEGHSCLQASPFDAQYKVLEHLIKEHGCKDIAYVRGPVGHPEADKRFEAYCQVLKDYNIPFKEENVLQGTFSLESGINAAVQMNIMGIKPQAIACASDFMAIGVLEYFRMIGIRVPEDVLLTGFDNSEVGMYSNPSITSIDKNPHELGCKAISEILDIIDGKMPENTCVSSDPILRESCGCESAEEIDVDKVKFRYIQKEIYATHLAEVINSNQAEFSGLQSPEEILPILQNTIGKFNLKAFYFCLCDTAKVFALPESNMSGDFELHEVNTNYTEEMEVPLAYENDAVNSYKAFPKGMVLPKEIRERTGGGNYYVVTPIFFQNCCFGYIVSGNDKLALMNTLYYSWLTNIGVALENIRKKMLLQDAIVRLNKVWSYDMLTQLYNRAGFYYEAKTVMECMKQQESKIFVLFCDVDGLKKINDTQGHEAGDELIKQMAVCFKENLADGMLAMRYGGDEFVIFGSYEEDAELESLLEGIGHSMDKRNATGKNSFVLSASMGLSKYNAKDVNELSELIDIADAKMYEEKRKKREQRENNKIVEATK